MRPSLLVLAAFAFGALLGLPRLPAARDAAAPPDAFAAGRAMAHVRAWATEPRPRGSAAHARVLDGVAAELGAVGLPVEREARAGLVNLVVRPTATEGRTVWLTAHSDSVPEAPGAADDGLGLAVIVEAARALSVAGVPPRLGVLVTDGEEEGLLGAKLHAGNDGAPNVVHVLHGADGAERRVAASPRLVLNVEARGTEGPAYMFQTAGPTGPLLDAWRASGCRAQATSLARAIYDVMPNDTDFTVFRRRGWWGYDFALIHGAWRYHTAEDTPDHLDPRSVQQVGDCVLGLARAWLAEGAAAGAGGGAEAAAPASGGDPVYAQLAGRTVVVPGLLVRAVGALTLVALVALGRGRVVAGALAWVLSLPLAFGAGAGLLAATAALRPDFWERPAEVVGPGPHYAAAVAVSLVVAGLALRITRRWGTRGWHVAAGVVGALAAVLHPAAGYVFLPGAQASAALLVGRPGLAAPPALLGGLLVGPVLYAVFPALTTRATPILCVLPLVLLAWLAPPPRAEAPR